MRYHALQRIQRNAPHTFLVRGVHSLAALVAYVVVFGREQRQEKQYLTCAFQSTQLFYHHEDH